MRVRLLVVPYDAAQRGVRMGAGPERLADALDAALRDAGHDVAREVLDPPAGSWRAEIRTAFELAAATADAVRAARTSGAFPIVLAGNCFTSLGVVAALGAGTGIVWLDAHGDLNTPETTTSGMLDGMALAAITGRCWRAASRRVSGFVPVADRHVWLLGARDLDPAEAELLERSAITHLPSETLGAGTGDAVRRDAEGARHLHLHLDLDVLDAGAGRANEFAASGGVSAETLAATCASLARAVAPAALTVSAYDPACDADGRARAAAYDAVMALLTNLPGSTA